jgi:hypothetical protein
MPDLIRHPEVVPVKIGNHLYGWMPFSPGTLDSGFRRNDDSLTRFLSPKKEGKNY